MKIVGYFKDLKNPNKFVAVLDEEAHGNPYYRQCIYIFPDKQNGKLTSSLTVCDTRQLKRPLAPNKRVTKAELPPKVRKIIKEWENKFKEA